MKNQFIISGLLMAILLVMAAYKTNEPAITEGKELSETVTTTDSISRLTEADDLLSLLDFNTIFPEFQEEETFDFIYKDVTLKFNARDKEHVRATDPKLFSTDNEELICLSLLNQQDFCFPLPNARVISPYAGRRRNHSGTDLKTFANDTIRSAFNGVVRMSKFYAAYGNVIVVRHYNGLETVYSHNSRNLVKPGDEVCAGQPLALLGRTGRATTEHLHFETRINGQHFNPELIIDMENRTLRNINLLCQKKQNTIAIKTVDVYLHEMANGSYHPNPFSPLPANPMQH